MIPDEILDPANDRVIKIHNSEYEPWVVMKDGTRVGWSDLAAALKEARDALRDNLEDSGLMGGRDRIYERCRAVLPEHQETL